MSEALFPVASQRPVKETANPAASSPSLRRREEPQIPTAAATSARASAPVFGLMSRRTPAATPPATANQLGHASFVVEQDRQRECKHDRDADLGLRAGGAATAIT